MRPRCVGQWDSSYTRSRCVRATGGRFLDDDDDDDTTGTVSSGQDAASCRGGGGRGSSTSTRRVRRYDTQLHLLFPSSSTSPLYHRHLLLPSTAVFVNGARARARVPDYSLCVDECVRQYVYIRTYLSLSSALCVCVCICVCMVCIK